MYSLWVAVLALLSGSSRFEKYNMTAFQIVRTYFAVALLAGVILAVLRPLMVRPWGRVGVGALIGTAIYTGVGFSMYGADTLTFVGGAVIGVPMGAILALTWRE